MKGERELLLPAVGATVRRLRDGLGLTRRELAKKSGVSERFLADLEGGQGNISVLRLHDVARALGSSAAELLLAAQPDRTDRRMVALVALRGAGQGTIRRALAARPAPPFVTAPPLVSEDP